jgi:transcriptional regulator with XRE-family HTH domain
MRRLERWLSDTDTNHAVLAEQVGVTASAISQYVRGFNQPSLGTLRALSKATGLSIDELVGPADEDVA